MKKKKRILVFVIFCFVFIFISLINAEPNASQSQESKAERLTTQLVNGQEMDNTIHALVAIGDPAIPALTRHFKAEKQDFSLRHTIIRIMGEIGTDNAKESLKEIAISKNDINPNLKGWAAHHFIKLIRNKEEAVPLIDSNDIDVRSEGLRAIQGIELDANLVSKVGVFLTNNEQAIRWSSISVYEKDPSQNFYRQKIDFILRAVDKVYTYTDANKVPFRAYYTFAQLDLQNYINALSNMNGPLSSLQVIHRETLTELAGDVLIIARASKGDKSVKSDIISIIKNRKEMLLRLRAVDSMEKIGSAEDIEFLQSVANTDPYCYTGSGDVPTPPGQSGIHYPIREVAKGVIQKISKK
ncbi:MAG: HEAT repeat domain-containing protein [Sedimentisphaerales bacterium]